MRKEINLARVVMYQNVGFLAIIALCYLDDFTRLSTWIFYRNPLVFEYRRPMLAMLLILTVWLLVSTSTRRLLRRLRQLEQYLHVCAWCKRIDYQGHWIPLEEFMKKEFRTGTTHGICPECVTKQKPGDEQ